MTVAKHALDNNKYFMMNVSAPFIPQFYKDNLSQALPYVDIFFGNEVEAHAFAKEFELGSEDLRVIGEKISKLPKLNDKRERVVIITQVSLKC